MTDDKPKAAQPTGTWIRKLGRRLSGGPRTREDILSFVAEVREAELLDAEAAAMIRGVLNTAELHVRDIMVPRAQMVVVERDASFAQVLEAVIESGHSRYPVVGESRDQVLGILLAKDLLRYTRGEDATSVDLTALVRPVVFVPESKRVNVLLKDFKGGRTHMAIVADEYGGVAGLVTIEDVLEQIVGKIDDEYDESEGAQILKQDERRYLVHGLTPIKDFNRYFKANLADDEFDTVGGLVVHRFGHMPRRGESVRLDRFQFNVQKADSRRVQTLQVTVSTDGQ